MPQNLPRLPLQTHAKPIFIGAEQRRKGSIYLEEFKNKTYSFKREKVRKLFNEVTRQSFLALPNPTKPDEVDKVNEPNYCPYHRHLGHTIEDDYPFKEWLEKAIQNYLHFPQDVSKILQCKLPMSLPWMRQPPPPKIGKVMTVGSRGQILCLALTLIPIQT